MKKTCAMCGAELEGTAVRCQFCGENVSGSAAGRRADLYQPSTSLVMSLTVLLLAGAVLNLISAGSDWMEIELLAEARGGAEISIERADSNDTRQALIGFTQLGVFLITAISFCVWLSRANRNAQALSAHDLTFTPGWTVGWFFIPIANLFKPYQAVKEIWTASDPHEVGHGSSLLGAWWAFWIISNVVGRIVFRLSRNAESVDELLSASQAGLAANLIDIVLTFLALAVVREIHSRQQEKHRLLMTA